MEFSFLLDWRHVVNSRFLPPLALMPLSGASSAPIDLAVSSLLQCTTASPAKPTFDLRNRLPKGGRVAPDQVCRQPTKPGVSCLQMRSGATTSCPWDYFGVTVSQVRPCSASMLQYGTFYGT